MKLRRFLLAGAFALAAAMVCVTAQAAPDRNYPVNGASALQIEVRSGDLVAVPDPWLKVVQVHVRGAAAAPAPSLKVTRNGRTLKLTLEGPGRPALPFAGNNGHVFEVHYPPALALRVRQFGGGVSVTKPRAPVEIYNGAGGITVTQPLAAVTALADTGDVQVSGAHSTLELTAQNGNVRADLAPDFSGKLVRLEAQTGNLALAVPKNFRARYDATAGTGTVTNPLPSVGRSALVFLLTQTGNVTVSVENP